MENKSRVYQYKFLFSQGGNKIVTKSLATERKLEEQDICDFGDYGRFKVYSIDHELEIHDTPGDNTCFVTDKGCYIVRLIRMLEIKSDHYQK